MEVVLGKYNQGGVSYVNVANSRGATYFQVDDWDGLVNSVGGEQNVWNVNQAFLQQQLDAGKSFILSHDPATATGYFLKEVNFLQNNGFQFIQDGPLWRAVQ